MHLIVLLICFCQTFTLPVTTENPTCPPCEWTEWYNVDHPKDNSSSGDWETLENITARGFDVCKVPRDIRCRSVRFPYIPFNELLYNTQCDRSSGLTCLNKNNEAPCIDFEVQFLCCPCDQKPELPDHTSTEIPTSLENPTCPPCEWTEWYNVDHPKDNSSSGDWETLENITARGFDVCKVPRDIRCRSVRFPYIPFNELLYNTQCDRSSGLTCLNKNNEAPCIDFEVQFLCCPCDQKPELPDHTSTEIPTFLENPTCPPCKWTGWYNVDHPKDDSNSGDWETVENITARGFDVCKVPRDIKCRSARFPYVPFKELLYNTQCDRSTGLVCLNKNNEAPCIDFEVQFLCCPCDHKPELPDHTSTEIPTSLKNPTCPPCEWTEWFNVDHPKDDSNSGDWETLENITARGFDVCKVPRDIKCRSARFPYVPFKELLYNSQCDRSAGLVCLNKNNEAPCIDFEVQFFCCPCDEVPPEPSATQMPALPTEIPTCPPCEWTEWFNVDHPKGDSNSGDWETLENITARGFDVCKVPRDIKCRSARFPYVPFNELLYNTQCDRSAGLVCLNKNNEAPCIDFEVQFLCCSCDQKPELRDHTSTEIPTSPEISTCPPCEWTEWFNVDHPKDDSNSGDWETLENITAHGFDVCKVPRDIKCRSARFPYVPFNKLLYNTQCNRSSGLTCLNKNKEAPCIDFEVQFLCCPCDQKPELPVHTSTEIPTSPKISTCPPCEWTGWYNVDHPKDDSNSGDWETLENITARGFDVCKIPRAIKCRSARFPYIPFKELQYNSQCDRSSGLVCLNKNNEAPCIDFEVQFLCCPCDQKPELRGHTSTEIPSSPKIHTCPPCEWTEWFNVDHPKDNSNSGDWETLENITACGFDVCKLPRDIRCRSARFPYVPFKELQYNTQCDRSAGLVCLNKNNKAPCIDFEVQFLCCPCDEMPPEPSATQMPALPTGIPGTGHNAQCTWTDWFNTHQATPGPDGGDFENVTAIMNQGYSICTAPQAAECRLVRFPYIPLGELYYIQECSASRGLVCANKNQESGECLDYEARFLCCTHDDNQYTVASNNRPDDTTDLGASVSSDTTHLTSTAWFN
ncbi:mucin-5AC-like [Eleutherodactylus coqui]|uniref:mucin-5AC-like n=1 Tax=Eleutherodactylus coqui TaxID=57060 RepID=UPI0034622CEC